MAICTDTTIGKALIETLREALNSGIITESLILRITNIYEKTIWDAIHNRSKLKVVIHRSRLVGSRHIDGQWTLIKKNVSIKLGYRRPFNVEKLKIIAIPTRQPNTNITTTTTTTTRAAETSMIEDE